MYRAVVNAGCRAGRLAAALEGVSVTLRRLAQIRRMTAAAIVYPLLVVITALLLFVLVIRDVFQPLLEAFSLQRVELPVANERFAKFATNYGDKLIWFIPAILLIVIYWWWASGRDFMAGSQWIRPGIMWIPGTSRLVRLGARNIFAEVLRLLVDHQVPLEDALRLAGNSTGQKDFQQESEELATLIEQGRLDSWRPDQHVALPPLLACLVCRSASPERLRAGLQSASRSYERQSTAYTHWFAQFAPILATLVIGGVTVFCYAMSLMVPWLVFLRMQSQQIVPSS